MVFRARTEVDNGPDSRHAQCWRLRYARFTCVATSTSFAFSKILSVLVHSRLNDSRRYGMAASSGGPLTIAPPGSFLSTT
jgi:hypothetical protein